MGVDGGWKRLTLDVAVGVVLMTGFGVESILIADETASVEAKLVGTGDEPIISCQLLSMGVSGGDNVRYSLRALAIAIDNIDVIHLESVRPDVDRGTLIQRSRLRRGNGMGDSNLVLLVRARVGRLTVHGELSLVADGELLLVRAGTNEDAGVGCGGAESVQRSADG